MSVVGVTKYIYRMHKESQPIVWCRCNYLSMPLTGSGHPGNNELPWAPSTPTTMPRHSDGKRGSQWKPEKRTIFERPWGRFKNEYELLNLRALKISTLHTNHIFQCMDKILGWNFKGTLWNSSQNILPIHWKMDILFSFENLRTLRVKSS